MRLKPVERQVPVMTNGPSASESAAAEAAAGDRAGAMLAAQCLDGAEPAG